jgi:hypothetical protein
MCPLRSAIIRRGERISIEFLHGCDTLRQADQSFTFTAQSLYTVMMLLPASTPPDTRQYAKDLVNEWNEKVSYHNWNLDEAITTDIVQSFSERSFTDDEHPVHRHLLRLT